MVCTSSVHHLDSSSRTLSRGAPKRWKAQCSWCVQVQRAFIIYLALKISFTGRLTPWCVSLHTWVLCDFAISFLRLAGCILLAAHLLNNLHTRSHLHAPHKSSWTSCEMCVSCMALKNLDDITKAAAALSWAAWIFCVCRERPSMETWWIIIICALTLIIVASHLCAHSERRDGGKRKNGFWARAPAPLATKSGARTHVCVVEIIICAHTWLIADCWCQGGSSALFDSRTFAAAI